MAARPINVNVNDPHAVAADALLDFNCLPLRTLHDSWYAGLPDGDLVVRLRGRPRVERRLNQWLLDRHGLNARFWFQPEQPFERLALLDGERLLKLVVYTGLTLNAKRIQHTLIGDDVRLIKQSIGQPAYQFALKRAPFLGPLPPGLLPPSAYSDDFYCHTSACGTRALAVAFAARRAGPDPALLARILFRLPRSLAGYAGDTPPTPDTATATAALLLRVATELELT